jgi:putative aldouronate transport system permease protein
MESRDKASQIPINAFLMAFSALCILPFVLLFISSITDEDTIIREGYSLFPSKFSVYAYTYLKDNIQAMARAFAVSIFVTLVGTALSLLVMSMLAYPLSRKGMPLAEFFTFFVFFTMLFNGGLVPTYMVYTKLLGMKNSILSLIVPYLLVRPFYVLLLKTFFSVSIPPAILESARIDGAGEWTVFFKIAIPLSMPVLATVGLFQIVNFWNDWFNGMIFLTEARLFSFQNLLNRILLDVQFLSTSAMGDIAAQGSAAVPTMTIRMALAFIGIVPIIVTYPFLHKYFAKGLTIGGVKG